IYVVSAYLRIALSLTILTSSTSASFSKTYNFGTTTGFKSLPKSHNLFTTTPKAPKGHAPRPFLTKTINDSVNESHDETPCQDSNLSSKFNLSLLCQRQYEPQFSVPLDLGETTTFYQFISMF
ncbi:hypothetical protein TorRG33x02_353870, partial [Trema orientale]